MNISTLSEPFVIPSFIKKKKKKKKKSPDSLTIRALKKDSSLVQIHKHCLVGSNENQGLMLHTKKAQ